ncbi:hypothetical protein OHA70_15560 [Kribbella sp. NBC_00382]|uniref:hypothetical protein n=1 Tax=Kribbella sp. NBC_00382 TaxID=2975967 RepID=UPI002E226322
MQSAWVGTISALAGIALAGGIAMVRDRMSEKRQAARDEVRRRHEVEEARFASRKDAYVSFAAACQKTINSTDEYEDEHQVRPGDMGYEGPHRSVIEAMNLVLIIGPKDVSDAAVEAAVRLHEWAFVSGTRAEAVAAVDQFQAVSRRILKFDLD